MASPAALLRLGIKFGLFWQRESCWLVSPGTLVQVDTLEGAIVPTDDIPNHLETKRHYLVFDIK